MSTAISTVTEAPDGVHLALNVSILRPSMPSTSTLSTSHSMVTYTIDEPFQVEINGYCLASVTA